MPIFSYVCLECQKREDRNVPISERNDQFCVEGHHLKKTFEFKGAVFSGTANGGMKV
jgi:predicted nucleic acid-binding Zn ribbon protein